MSPQLLQQFIHFLPTRLVLKIRVQYLLLTLLAQCQEANLGLSMVLIILGHGLSLHYFLAKLKQAVLALLVELIHVLHEELHQGVLPWFLILVDLAWVHIRYSGILSGLLFTLEVPHTFIDLFCQIGILKSLAVNDLLCTHAFLGDTCLITISFHCLANRWE